MRLIKCVWITQFALVLFSTLSNAQTTPKYLLIGSVYDAETNQGLPGATIRVVGTTLGTTTNSDGQYRLLMLPGTYKLLSAGSRRSHAGLPSVTETF
jgi:hypothetical protein